MKIIKYIIAFAFISFMPHSVHSQNWPKIYNGNFHSFINELEETYDKGYMLIGYINSPYSFSKFISIIKTDINGNILWNKRIGDLVHQYYASNSAKTNDNGLIISGAVTKYSSGDFDPVFIKINVCGEIEWCRVLTCPDINYATGVIQTNDGSFIGMLTYYGVDSTYSRISLVKLDQTGEPIWIQRLAQEDTLIYNEEGYQLLMTQDSRYLVSGRVFYPGMKPYWILTDTSGQQLWDLKWSGVIGICFNTVEFDPGTFYSAGYEILPTTNNLPVIYKFDNSGNQIDDFLLLGDTIYNGGARPISKMNDSTLLTGVVWRSLNSNTFHSEVIQTDTLGNLINRRLLLQNDYEPMNILLTSDNHILVAGFYSVSGYFNIYLWKMNTDLEDDTLYTQPITYDSLCPYQITSDTVDMDCELFVDIEDIPTKKAYESTVKISPNPATDWILLTFPDNIHDGKIDLAVYDLFGREVIRKNAVSANRMITLEISGLSSGLYVVVGKDRNGNILTGKFIIAR